jgi:hypothetical protein
MDWLKKNLRYITMILVALLFIKTFQSCNRKMSMRVVEKNLTEERDSLLYMKDQIISGKNLVIDSLEKENITKDFLIKDLYNDLEIAGVRVNEAQRRADAVQQTAESVRSNTTIEVRGVEKDTTENKK